MFLHSLGMLLASLFRVELVDFVFDFVLTNYKKKTERKRIVEAETSIL